MKGRDRLGATVFTTRADGRARRGRRPGLHGLSVPLHWRPATVAVTFAGTRRMICGGSCPNCPRSGPKAFESHARSRPTRAWLANGREGRESSSVPLSAEALACSSSLRGRLTCAGFDDQRSAVSPAPSCRPTSSVSAARIRFQTASMRSGGSVKCRGPAILTGLRARRSSSEEIISFPTKETRGSLRLGQIGKATRALER